MNKDSAFHQVDTHPVVNGFPSDLYNATPT